MSRPMYDQQEQRVDRQYNAGRDIYNSTTIGDDNLANLVGGGWVAGLVTVLGAVIMLAGFAIWVSMIFSAGDASSADALFHTRGPIGFGMFVGGSIIASIGQVMGYAHRRRSR